MAVAAKAQTSNLSERIAVDQLAVPAGRERVATVALDDASGSDL
jgi:hypothetical protein